MSNKHTEFWLALLKCGNSDLQCRRYWHGYLAWKLPDEVKSVMDDVIGTVLLGQAAPNKPMGLDKGMREELNYLAELHGGHPQYSEQLRGGLGPFMDFSGVTFNGESFEGQILLQADFNKTKFLDVANFKNAKFMDFAVGTRFEGATFADSARFDDVTFGSSVYFNDATFEDEASFDGVKFKKDAIFAGSKFAPKVSSEGDSFGRVRFRKSMFMGEADFDQVKFVKAVDFTGANFKDRVSFKAARFEDRANFNDASFKAATSFNRVLFKQPPMFFETSLHEDTDFGGVDWREAESSYARSWWGGIRTLAIGDRTNSGYISLGVDEAVRAWDRLALIMSKLEKLPDRHTFYRLRMRAQRKQDGYGLLSAVNWLFDVSSDYGWSVYRALASWLIHWISMALVLFVGSSHVPPVSGCGSVFWDSVRTSFANAHAFLGLASKDGYLFNARECLAAASHAGSILSVVGVLQSVLGPILLFLVLLTMRNRFRLR